MKVAIEGKVHYRAGMPIGGVYRAFSFSPAELFSIFGRRESNTLVRFKNAQIDAGVDIYNSHFSEGLDAFKAGVLDEHHKLICGVPPIPPHRLPFLRKFGVCELSLSSAVESIVDGQRKKRSFISEYRNDDLCVLKRSPYPISDSELKLLKDEYIHRVMSPVVRSA
ncbi:hypothetical protein E0H70_35865 [Rhizobium leguminosarum bv. viciae]|nr:hypothetical protein E0H70_35865 [Rhizobium leguminosarum bv. viciae]